MNSHSSLESDAMQAPAPDNTLQRKEIRLLPPELRNQIAAGEVVERPSSVLKELVENSLDAGAKNIHVELERGGQGLLLVQDDGQGLAPDELELAVTRHATSKLQRLEDLQEISSYGFRGEALPSIASVSRCSMTAAVQGADGWRLEVEFGQVVAQGPAAMKQGARVEIRDLFGNVPARLKFLKTHSTEASRCQDTLFRLALARLEVGFTFVSGGRQVFQLLAGESLRRRLAPLWPPNIVDAMAPFELRHDEWRVHGLAGDPGKAQGRGARILLYVNGRAVQDRLLLRAVQDAYKGRLLAREYPQTVVFLELPPCEVDVNVHPAKAEVRFRDENRVFSLVRRSVAEAVERMSPNIAPPVRKAQPTGDWQQKLPEKFRDKSPDAGRQTTQASFEALGKKDNNAGYSLREPQGTAQSFSRPVPGLEQVLDSWSPPQEQPRQAPLSPVPGKAAQQVSEKQATEPPPAFAQPAKPEPETGPAPSATMAQEGFDLGECSYLGRLADSYLVLKLGEGALALLDQHAAHERVLYERLKRKGQRGESQLLALPLTLSLHQSEARRLRELWSELEALGFVLHSHGDSLSISGVPAQLTQGAAREYLQAALSGQAGGMEDLWKLMACKTAIKAGQPLARDEALHLLEQWLATPERQYCPHGRPVLLSWELGELEKLFKRRN